jgi:hypothetical protein
MLYSTGTVCTVCTAKSGLNLGGSVSERWAEIGDMWISPPAFELVKLIDRQAAVSCESNDDAIAAMKRHTKT